MLYWALVFLVLALAAGWLGFHGFARSAETAGRILFVAFLALFIAGLLRRALRRRR